MRLHAPRRLLRRLRALRSPAATTDGDALRDARYAYTVWLRHLTRLARLGVRWPVSDVVELGPGGSLGVGLAALLSGAERYVALDVHPLADPVRDAAVLDGLASLFAAAAPIPAGDEFPTVHPLPPSPDFPHATLPRELRAAALAPERLCRLRAALAAPADGDHRGAMRYVVPWRPDDVPPASADLVISQAVLQELPHEPDGGALRAAFRAMHRWLRPGGVMSHQIDFASPYGPAWNRHWAMSDATWRILGMRYRVNRAPLSAYLALCEECGFEVLGVARVPGDGVRHDRLAPRFRSLPVDDYVVRSAHVAARRR